MAVRFWVATSGEKSWADTANWSATDGGAGGASVPATGDTVYVNRGSASIVTGLNQSAVSLAALNVNFGGKIGSDGSYLAIGLQSSTTSTLAGGHGGLYLAPSCGDAAVVNVGRHDAVVKFGGGSNTVVAFEPTLYLGDAGTFILGGDCSFSGVIRSSGMGVIVEAGTGDYSLVMEGGRAEIARTPLLAYAYYRGLIRNVSASTTLAGCEAAYGGVYIHNSPTTISVASARTGGKITAAGASSPFTVSASAKWPEASLFENSPVPITLTTPTVVYGGPTT